tara:strand:+ start:3001 stop:3171 length:171 start_codon:yes stop_codon:yes gene_type:complete
MEELQIMINAIQKAQAGEKYTLQDMSQILPAIAKVSDLVRQATQDAEKTSNLKKTP